MGGDVQILTAVDGEPRFEYETAANGSERGMTRATAESATSSGFIVKMPAATELPGASEQVMFGRVSVTVG